MPAKITGTTKRVSAVDAITPPMTVHAADVVRRPSVAWGETYLLPEIGPTRPRAGSGA